MSPAILWTYDSNECCRSADWSDFYFQRHLLMNVMPMLPFPGNDHAIPFDPVSAAVYVRYGAMMAAVAPSVWALFPHIISTANSSSTTTAKVNAFIAPLAGATDVALLIPVVLGADANGTVTLNLTCISRVWPADAADSAHPLVRKRARARATAAPLIGAAAAPTYIFEAMWPGGAGDAWTTIAGPFDADSALVNVTLQSGGALVRARRVV